MTLNEVKPGNTVKVVSLTGEGGKIAPLGDPIELTVRGYELSIRKADAGFIEVI